MKFRLRPSSLDTEIKPTKSEPIDLTALAATIAEFVRMADEDAVHLIQLSSTNRLKLTSRVRVAWGNRVPYVELQYQFLANARWEAVS